MQGEQQTMPKKIQPKALFQLKSPHSDFTIPQWPINQPENFINNSISLEKYKEIFQGTNLEIANNAVKLLHRLP